MLVEAKIDPVHLHRDAPPEAERPVFCEGGLAPVEYLAAETSGFETVSLGPRILRTETAPVAALAVLQALWGDL